MIPVNPVGPYLKCHGEWKRHCAHSITLFVTLALSLFSIFVVAIAFDSHRVWRLPYNLCVKTAILLKKEGSIGLITLSVVGGGSLTYYFWYIGSPEGCALRHLRTETKREVISQEQEAFRQQFKCIQQHYDRQYLSKFLSAFSFTKEWGGEETSSAIKKVIQPGEVLFILKTFGERRKTLLAITHDKQEEIVDWQWIEKRHNPPNTTGIDCYLRGKMKEGSHSLKRDFQVDDSDDVPDNEKYIQYAFDFLQKRKDLHTLILPVVS